jgi:hypothetical protein
MKYMLFYTGVASTPDTVGLKCLTNNEIIHEISVSMPSGKETREKYSKFMGILKRKYSTL